MVLVERDPPSELQELIALCTAETFNFLCEPDKAEWLVGEIVSELPLPPHAARPLARYAVKLLAQAADAQAMAGAGWVARKAAQLAVALLQRLPYSDKLCRAIAGRLRKLNSDVLARHEAERAIAEAGYKVDPELAQRLSLDLRADLRQLEMIEELRDQVSGIEAALGAEHQDLKDYLNESLNPQPPLHMPLIVDDEQARFVFRAPPRAVRGSRPRAVGPAAIARSRGAVPMVASDRTGRHRQKPARARVLHARAQSLARGVPR